MKNKKIGIMCAMPVEFDAIAAFLEEKTKINIRKNEITVGKLGENTVFLTLTGVGKVAAAMCTQALILSESPDLIINIGVAGALDPTLDTLSTVVADFTVQHDMDTSAVGDPRGMISGICITRLPCDKETSDVLFAKAGELSNAFRGGIASGDKFVADKAEKKEIASFFDTIACDMEAAAVCQVCYVNGVPCTVLRTISDSLEKGSAMDYETFKPLAADLAARILKKSLAG